MSYVWKRRADLKESKTHLVGTSRRCLCGLVIFPKQDWREYAPQEGERCSTCVKRLNSPFPWTSLNL